MHIADGYHGSKALAKASVTISFKSEKEKIAFQKGNTDINGNFCFYPDKAGQWIVLVDDLMGHRGKKTITLSEDFFNTLLSPKEEKSEVIPIKEKNKPAAKKDTAQPGTTDVLCCFLLKVALGVLLILAVTYIVYRWRKQYESSSNRENEK